jgi:hypothetical protein
MIAPTPRLVRDTGPKTRRRRFSPFISSRRSAKGFFANSEFAMNGSPEIIFPTADFILIKTYIVFTGKAKEIEKTRPGFLEEDPG